MLTEKQFRQMMPNAGDRLNAHWPYINPAMADGNIKTPRAIAAFLAQLAHESGEYRYMEELADGSAYEGRVDLGNTYPGDGVKFKGHGPLQITGRRNHLACGIALGINLIENPRLITLPEYGTRSAVWFWNKNKLTPPADVDWFKYITRVINGGYNGLTDRCRYWDNNRKILDLPYVNVNNEEFEIARFQLAHGLMSDGIIGRKTLAALHSLYEGT